VADQVPAALLEAAWHDSSVSDDDVLSMARRLAKVKRRGQDLPEDDVDLDPACRSLAVLEQVVLSASRAATVAPRTALPVVGLDSRRVRYVLTALPTWRGRLSGAMLGRVLKQNAGAISAAHAEARSRGAEVRGWTERMMNDIELSVALAIGHTTARAVVDRVSSGRHRLEDGVSLASAAEARAVLEGADAIKPLMAWAQAHKGSSGPALAFWLLLERHDRARSIAMLASSIDTFAVRQNVVPSVVTEALAQLERRHAGTLERMCAQTPRGKATVASAIARAYRAVGGLRDER
jgi:hypothetical protein